jgi:tetratricopeptide (TPR) repeat protein
MTVQVRGQEQNQLDGSPALFSIMAAINAAGYDAEIDSPANHPLRSMVRKHLASRQLTTLPELKKFVASHRRDDPASELSQYISFALSTSGPPDFKMRYAEHEIPPDVLPMTGFENLMTRFHREAAIDQLWKQAQPALDQAIARYHAGVSRAVLEVNGYLRNPTSGYLGRRFQIYIDLLAPPNQIQTRSYGDDYFVVLTPSPEPQIDDVRHAYLHYLLDPLNFKHASRWEKKKGHYLMDYAQSAPALEEYYKNDFLLLATESLIKAVESRLARGNKQAVVDQALREGFVLAPFFAEQLPLYEKQEQSMRFFYPDMIDALDLKKEEKRLEGVQFAATRAVRKAKVVPAERKVEVTGVFKTLEEAEELYRSRDLDGARQKFRKALQETDEKPLHAKSYYGLARIAALQRDPELADKLFRRTLELEPDPATRSWAHLYLGRLADLAGDRDQATRNYQAAAAVEGGSAAARQAAQKGLQEAFQKDQTEKKE